MILSGSSGDTPGLGALIRRQRLRRGWSLGYLAGRVSSSASHLSRIERGDRSAVSKELAGRLAGELGLDPGDVFLAAGGLPPAIESELAHREFSLALADGHGVPQQTQRALRRISTERSVAKSLVAPASLPVDPEKLLTERGVVPTLGVATAPGVQLEGGQVTVTGRSPVERRFLTAHALCHVLAGQVACTFPQYAPDEQRASVGAGVILMPAPVLMDALHEAASRVDPAGQASALVELIAGRFGVPEWLAAQRLGELGLFAEAAAIPWQ